MFLTDHVLHNKIITNEEAGEKKGTQGTTEQLPQDIEILGWCPVGPVLPHGEKVPL